MVFAKVRRRTTTMKTMTRRTSRSSKRMMTTRIQKLKTVENNVAQGCYSFVLDFQAYARAFASLDEFLGTLAIREV